MSSATPKGKLSANEQVEVALSAVKDFLAGRSGDAQVTVTEDKATREAVGAELLATMSGHSAKQASRDEAAEPSRSDTQEIPHFDGEAATSRETREQRQAQEIFQSDAGVVSREREHGQHSKERERARKLFLDHGYFDEVVQDLRTANSPAERAAAARALGLVGSQRGTAHLVAAMFDDYPEVRSAAEEALSKMGDPTLANVKVDAVLNTETERINEAESPRFKVAQQGWEDERAPWEVVIASVKSDIAQQGGQDARAPGEMENPVQQTVADPTTASDLIATNLTTTNSIPTTDEEQLLLKEHRIKESAEQLVRELVETAAARNQSEQEIQLRIEREARLRAEAAARRSEEEELRKRADEEAELRRTQEREVVTAEQVARVKAETEAERLAEEETSLRLQAVDLRLAAAELARQRVSGETACREAAEAERQAEATRARDEAQLQHDTELARLRSEEEAMRTKADEIVLRRAELEAAREKADAEAERLVEALARMQAAEEARAQAEAERSQLEAEINQRVETARRLLEDTRRRGQEEQERLQEETRRRAEEEQHRLAELEFMRTRAEAESRQLAEKEQQILSQVNSLRTADADTRKRIEDAEVRRRAAEAAYRLVAEKVQRVEAEAHARAKEEEQMVAKLEAERRTVAVEAQSRTAQEKRIREEIEVFRRLEDQERPRLEAATLQRAEAEARLRQLRELLKAEEETRVSAEEQLSVVGDYERSSAQQPGATDWQTHRSENLSKPFSPATGEARETFTDASMAAPRESAISEGDTDSVDDVDAVAASAAAPSVFLYLNSVDPYKRAAAVVELARSGSKDAFSLIVNCFDDHSPHVRNAAARAFRKLEPNRTVDLFNRALEESSADRHRNIGAAIAASGLAMEAIDNLVSENREDTYNALSILFVMAKTGEVQPLVQAIEGHESVQVRMAAIKLLTLTGQSDIANTAAKRRLERHQPENYRS
jgi:hypothetical protein